MVTKEHAKLLRKWATGRASMKEMERCRELDQQAEHKAYMRAPCESWPRCACIAQGKNKDCQR